MATMLRVHSQDLHEHVASEAGECLDSGLYTDLAIRCGTEFNPVSLVSWNFTTKISKKKPTKISLYRNSLRTIDC